MKFTEDARSGIHLVRGYDERGVSIGEARHERPVVVAGTTLITDWPVAALSALSPADLAPVWALQPQVVLLGTGRSQRFPSAGLRRAFAERQVALEAMDLGAACRTYNVLVQEDRAVVALLFPESAT
jgi:uncharacterized protein